MALLILLLITTCATRYGLSRGLLGLKHDQINYSDSVSDSDSVYELYKYIILRFLHGIAHLITNNNLFTNYINILY